MNKGATSVAVAGSVPVWPGGWWVWSQETQILVECPVLDGRKSSVSGDIS